MFQQGRRDCDPRNQKKMALSIFLEYKPGLLFCCVGTLNVLIHCLNFLFICENI